MSAAPSQILAETARHRPRAVRAAWYGLVPMAAILGAALAMQFLVSRALGDFWTRMALVVGVNIVLAVSLNVVNGFTGQFSIGQAGFHAIGAYVAASITYYVSFAVWGKVPGAAREIAFLGAGEWLFFAACLAGGITAAGAGYIVGKPALRLRGDYLAIVTLGFGEIVRVLLQQTNPVLRGEALAAAGWKDYFPPPWGGAIGFSGIPKYASMFWVYLWVGMTLLLTYRLKESSTGREMIAIRENEIAAQAMGVNVARQKVLAFMISAFFAGVAGGLFVHREGSVRPLEAGFMRSFDVVIMVVLGGKGSISGVVLAAVVLSLLPEFLRGVEQYRLIAYALLLIVMMLVRPQGLFGTAEIWDGFLRRKIDSGPGGKSA
jgi:branched-chain amino acid transport system permease protein